MKLSQLYPQYLDYARNYQGRAVASVDRYRTHLRLFRQHLLQKYNQTSYDVWDVVLSDVLDFISRVRAGEFRVSKRGVPLHPRTVSHHATSVKHFFRRCYLHDIECIKYDKIPYISVKNDYKPEYLTRDQVREFRDCCLYENDELVGLRNLLILKIAYYTGMRGQEIQLLTFEQLLSDNDQVDIFGKVRSRSVYFRPEIKDLARKLHVWYYNRDPKLMYNNPHNRAFLTLSKTYFGKRITGATTKKIIRKYREKLWLSDKIKLHSFRHTFATQLLRSGVDLRSVQRALGHTNISATQIYTHIADTSFQKRDQVLNIA